MRRIAVINYKGGTGKTTTTLNIAYALSIKSYKVLIVDIDPQGSASFFCNHKPKYNLYDILIEDVPVEKCIQPLRHNLDIICSNERVFPAEIKMSNMPERELIIRKKFESLRNYDFILIDCPPSMNLLNQNALIFADELLLPVSMEYLSLIGVKQLLKNIKIINRIFYKGLSITGVIPTFYDNRNKKSKDILRSLKRVFSNVTTSPIRFCNSVSESAGRKKTIFEYDSESPAAEDFFKITEEILNGKK